MEWQNCFVRCLIGITVASVISVLCLIATYRRGTCSVEVTFISLVNKHKTQGTQSQTQIKQKNQRLQNETSATK